MIDTLVAEWLRITEPLRQTALGKALTRTLARRLKPPIADGFYLEQARRFEIGKIRNLMRQYSGDRHIRRMWVSIDRWRRFPNTYLVLRRAVGGRCVEPFLGATIILGISDEVGAAVLSGARAWTSVKTSELRAPPARYQYGQFLEAIDRRYRAPMMREVVIRASRNGTPDCIVMVRPVTEPALHFYRSRGFTRHDGSPPVMDEICYTPINQNPAFKAILGGNDASDD